MKTSNLSVKVIHRNDEYEKEIASNSVFVEFKMLLGIIQANIYEIRDVVGSKLHFTETTGDIIKDGDTIKYKEDYFDDVPGILAISRYILLGDNWKVIKLNKEQASIFKLFRTLPQEVLEYIYTDIKGNHEIPDNRH